MPGWNELLPEERSWARDRKPIRHREFVAGRVALRAALRAAGWSEDRPLLPLASGGPDLPGGYTGSITHKDGLALALAAPQQSGRTLGLDSEMVSPRDRSGIASRVLCPSEHRRWEAAGASWPALLETFSVKEAIYKALYPHVPRYIGFEEAELAEDGAIGLHLRDGEGTFHMRSVVRWEGDRLIVIVEAEPLG